jgi:hypothetical protein
MLDPKEMRANAEALVQHVVEEAPPGLGVCVILYDKIGGGAMSATSAKDGKELAEVLRSVLSTCEGAKDRLVLVKPS